MADHKSEEFKSLCEYFVSVAKISRDGNKIQVGRQEAEYKRRLVYGLKAQWESHIPCFVSYKSRFYPIDFEKDDRNGVINYLASKEADRIMEERAAQKAPKGQSPA